MYESAFRKIKEATGVSDVNEVIQKIVSQEDTQNNLMELTRENQAKIEAMNEEKQTMTEENQAMTAENQAMIQQNSVILEQKLVYIGARLLDIPW